MKTGFSIREAKRTDYQQVKEFIELVDNEFCPPLSERGKGIPERIDSCLDRPESNYLVATLPEKKESGTYNRFVGMIGYTQKWKKDDKAYINFLATHPEYRNLGISKKLCLKLEDFLSNRDCRSVHVCTWSSNPAAMRFYRELGYHTYTVVLNDRGRGINTIYYKKRICIK